MNLSTRLSKLESVAALHAETCEPLDLAYYDLSLVGSNDLIKAEMILGHESPDAKEIARLLEAGNIAPERVTRDLATHNRNATQAAGRVHSALMRRFYTWAACASVAVTLPHDANEYSRFD